MDSFSYPLKMRHLRSINENKVHQDNIDLIVDIGDIFIFLEDDWGFDIKCTFTEINDNLTLGFRNIRKYNKNGTIYAEKNSDISRFGRENESRKRQNANSPLEFGVRINLQFRK